MNQPMSFEVFQAKARSLFQVADLEIECADPFTFLYAQSWVVPQGPAFSEDRVSEMNMSLDESGCFGRGLKALVLCEQFFPEQKFYAGEVCNDLLRVMLLDAASPEKWNDKTFIAELLQYESPHMVIVDAKGGQFDPIFSQLSRFPGTLTHPSVLKHDAWKGMYAAYLVSCALACRASDVQQYESILLEGLEVCPEMVLVQENMASMYWLTDRYQESIKMAQRAAEKRVDAKTLFFLYCTTNDGAYKTELIRRYDIQIFHFLNQNLLP